MSIAESLTSALDYLLQRSGKWQVMSKSGEVLGTYATKAEAAKRLRQIEFFKSNDIVSTDATLEKPTRLLNGYLSVWAKVTHPGVFDYHDENLDGSKKLVYRSAEDVFSNECMASFQAIDLTNGHPSEAWITDETFKSSAIGTVKRVTQDGNWLTANIIVKDKSSIDAILAGRKYVSVGWLREQVPTPGMVVTDPMTNQEVSVDFQHRKLQANHIALVPEGRSPRAGWGSAICTDYVKETMEKENITTQTPVEVPVANDETPVVVVAESIEVVVPELAVAEPEEELVLKSSYDASQAALLTATQRAESAEARIVQLQTELTQACSPEVIDALVATRMELASLASKWGVDSKGMTTTDIKLNVLRKAFPSISPDKFAQADYQAALWDVLPTPPSKSNDVAPVSKPSPTSITLDSVNVQAQKEAQSPRAKFHAEYFRPGRAQPSTSTEK